MKKMITMLKGLMAATTVLAAVMFSACAQPTFNDVNVQVRDVGTFNKIVVGGSFDVYLSQGEKEAVGVSARNQDETNRIKTEVRNGTLYIKYDNNSWGGGNLDLKAYVSVKELNRMDIGGACDVVTKGIISGSDMEISLSGSSDFSGSLNATNLKIEASGASDYRLQGKAQNCRIGASGSSDIKAFDLITDFCDIDVSGASDIQITVNKELKATGSGASDIQYKGTAVIREVRMSGASDIKKRD